MFKPLILPVPAKVIWLMKPPWKNVLIFWCISAWTPHTHQEHLVGLWPDTLFQAQKGKGAGPLQFTLPWSGITHPGRQRGHAAAQLCPLLPRGSLSAFISPLQSQINVSGSSWGGTCAPLSAWKGDRFPANSRSRSPTICSNFNFAGFQTHMLIRKTWQCER